MPAAAPQAAPIVATPILPSTIPVAAEEAQLRPANLKEALALYEDAASDHPARIKIRSGFRTIGRALRLPLDQIPA